MQGRAPGWLSGEALKGGGSEGVASPSVRRGLLARPPAGRLPLVRCDSWGRRFT